jgi:thiol-disulfide isomerase/thioredoxin
VTDFLAANPAAKDVAEIYSWTFDRAQQFMARTGFLTVASAYLGKNAGAADAMEWRRAFIQGGLKNEAFKEQAESSRAKLLEEGKTDASAAMLEIDLRLHEVLAARDATKSAEAIKSAADEVRSNSVIGKSTDVWVRRDRTRILLSAASAEIKVGEQFPCWSEVMDVQDLDGKPIKLADYKGKVVLIDFWAVWCGPCIGEMPNVVKAYKEFHDKGFEVIGISFDTRQGEEGLRETIKGEGDVGARTGVMPWRQIYDGGYWNSGFAKRYNVRGIPMTVLVGKDGKVIATEGLRDGALAKKLPVLLGLETAAESKSN